jgi:hypothetical protein
MSAADQERRVVKGGCLCGGIRFEIDSARSLTHCHCSNCRKLTGAAFASYVHVDESQFRLLSGKDLMQQFESSPGSFRTFCRICGSMAPGKAPYLSTVSIPAGLLDDDPGVRPNCTSLQARKRPGGTSTMDCRSMRSGCPASLRKTNKAHRRHPCDRSRARNPDVVANVQSRSLRPADQRP